MSQTFAVEIHKKDNKQVYAIFNHYIINVNREGKLDKFHFKQSALKRFEDMMRRQDIQWTLVTGGK